MLSESRVLSLNVSPPSPTRPPLRWRRQPSRAVVGRLNLLAPLLLLLGLLGGCSLLETKDPEPGDAGLTTVHKIKFTGNEAFSSRTLIKAMSTQPRPFWQFWKRGDFYNPETIEADLQRLRKFYFDRGYLSTSAMISKVKSDRENQTVTIAIDIDEGPRTVVQSVQIDGTVPPALHAETALAGRVADADRRDPSIKKILTKAKTSCA